MAQQLGLLPALERTPRPWKRARQVSRQQITELRDSGALVTRQQTFLDALAAHWDRVGVCPTLAELTQWAYGVGRIPRNDPNIFRPRATELGPGKRQRLTDGTYRITGGGVIEFLLVRTCQVTGGRAHPIRLREAGSRAAQ
jgi:hypothetical protein